MRHIVRRLSPSTLIATLALIAAGGGTAIAAGEIITSPDQIKNDVITGPKLAFHAVTSFKVAPDTIRSSHVLDRSVLRTDLRDPQLNVRALGNGGVLPGSDGSATRVAQGKYHVTFSPGLLNPGGGTRTLQSENCAFTATPRNKFAILSVSGPIAGAPNTVTVDAVFPDPVNPGSMKGSDTQFDITASC